MIEEMRQEFERTNGRDHRRQPPKGNNYIDPMAQADWESFQKGWNAARSPARERMVTIPLVRSYDVRVAMLLAFNTRKHEGGDQDDALEAAFQALLSKSGNEPVGEGEEALRKGLRAALAREAALEGAAFFNAGDENGLRQVGKVVEFEHPIRGLDVQLVPGSGVKAGDVLYTRPPYLHWGQFRELAREAYGQVVDYNAFGEPITDYDVILTGYYGPAVKRLAEMAAIRLNPAVPEGVPNLPGIVEVIQEGAGFWHSCSGCHETEDGHPVGSYQYSPAMQCALGSGCAECGGLGALWDNADYDAEIDALDADTDDDR